MSSLARALSGELPGLRASDDEADRVAYARDLWPRHHMEVRAGRPAEHRPGAIAWPTSAEEVARLVLWARARGVEIVPFGAGSGVCGGVLPREDVVVLDMKRMGRVRAIDRSAPLVDAEAGCLGLPLEQALERAGFTLGHFPSSILCSTVGGWVAARSAGQCSGAYGKIEDMVVALECVTGRGDVVDLRRRCSSPDLVPLVVGSEGTMAVVTSAKLRLHPAPRARAFGAWSFPSTRDGWEALRAIFQSGLRPAVSRLYDPFDAMLARRGGSGARPPSPERRAPGIGSAALRALLRRPGAVNALLHSRAAARALGGALLVVIFEGSGPETEAKLEGARRIVASMSGRWEGEAPARRWLAHRYAVSYRQAPVFANGAFVDTMEVAARWSKLGDVYEAVWRALGEHTFVMAHFSHAYPDGCCIYFSFAGSADPALARAGDWDRACEATYDRAWRAALTAAIDAGGTLGHHHGVGRSKAPRLAAELGAGVAAVRALMRAFDPGGLLNPGNLVPESASCPPVVPNPERVAPVDVDRESLLARASGGLHLADLERRLQTEGLTLDASFPPSVTVGDWLAEGAPGARDRWLDPADQLIAGLDGALEGGLAVSVRPAPRRSVGPDLTALFVGANRRFGRIDGAWLRVHRRGVPRPESAAFQNERDPPVNPGESSLLDAIESSLRGEIARR
jgi:alkyldihydroxyacetonephosphate synthase